MLNRQPCPPPLAHRCLRAVCVHKEKVSWPIESAITRRSINDLLVNLRAFKGKCLAGQWLVEADVNNKVPWIIGVPLKHVTANTDTLSDSR